MPKIDKGDVRLGFYIALGFFIFGIVLGAIMWAFRMVTKKAGGAP